MTWNPLRGMIVDLRDDPDVFDLVNIRIVGEDEDQGYARGEDAYVAYIKIVTLATHPEPRLPVQRARFAVHCYGRTKQEAFSVYAAAFGVLHNRGPRMHTDYGTYVSHDDTGAEYSQDPDTKQPVYTFICELLATTQVVTA